MGLRKMLILRKLPLRDAACGGSSGQGGCLEGRTALIQPIDNSFSVVLRSAAVHRASEFGDRLPRPFQVDTLRRGRLFPKGDSGSALGDGANGTRRKPTTAIRTDIEQHLFDALGAERALLRTNSGIGRVAADTGMQMRPRAVTRTSRSCWVGEIGRAGIGPRAWWCRAGATIPRTPKG